MSPMSPNGQERVNSLTETGHMARINADDWQEMLLDNYSRIIGGNVRYFQGIPIGLNTFAVKLLPKEWNGNEFGTVQLDPKTKWITSGTGLHLSPNKCNK